MPDLTTLLAIKQWDANLATANADAVLGSLITATSADFLREIERPDLLTANYTENRTGDGSTRLVLRHWPVTAITSVTIGGAAVASGTFGVDTTLDPERCYVLYLTGSQTFTDGAAVAVTYAAGYTAIPPDVGQAVVEWVMLRWRKKGSTGSKQMREAGGERTDVDTAEMPSNTQRVIDLYKRKWPGYGYTADQKAGGTGNAPKGAMISIPGFAAGAK